MVPLIHGACKDQILPLSSHSIVISTRNKALFLLTFDFPFLLHMRAVVSAKRVCCITK